MSSWKGCDYGLLATIEPIEGTLVKVTRWHPQTGCLCHMAIKVPKTALRVVPAEQKHSCCGKLHTVVEVRCSKDYSMPLQDIFQQLAGNLQSSARSNANSQTGNQGGPNCTLSLCNCPSSVQQMSRAPSVATPIAVARHGNG